MFMSDDKKKRATSVIISSMNPREALREAPMTEEGGISDQTMAEEAAADELIRAIAKSDAKGVVEAMKALMTLCAYEEAPEHEESED